MKRAIAAALLAAATAFLPTSAFANGLAPLKLLLEESRGSEQILSIIRTQPELLKSLSLLPEDTAAAATVLGTTDTELVQQILEMRGPAATGTMATGTVAVKTQCAAPTCLTDLGAAIDAAASTSLIPADAVEDADQLVAFLQRIDPALAKTHEQAIRSLADGTLPEADAAKLLDELSSDLMSRLDEAIAARNAPPQVRIAQHLEHNAPDLYARFGDRFRALDPGDPVAAERLGKELMIELAEDTQEAQAGLATAVRAAGLDLEEFAAAVKAADGDTEALAELAASLPPSVQAEASSWLTTTRNVAAASGLLYSFLVGVKGLGGAFKHMGAENVEQLIGATGDPIMGLSMGILGTTIVQSSSATTSMIVALVASGTLPPEAAIPMIMGANIGTTGTSTLASLAHLGRRGEFQKGFEAATVHDMFNLLAVSTLLPLEMATGVFAKTSAFLADQLTMAGIEGFKYHSPLKDLLSAGNAPIEWIAETVTSTPMAEAAVTATLDGVVIVGSIALLSTLMRSGLKEQAKTVLQAALSKSHALAMGAGTAITVGVQSSSITTSLLVPLAAAGAVTLEQVFPVVIGANIGTTTTALLAALAVDGAAATAALQVALTHTLFNGVGALAIYPFKPIRNIPMEGARRLAAAAAKRPGWAMAYVGTVFIVMPGGYIVAKHAFTEVPEEDTVTLEEAVSATAAQNAQGEVSDLPTFGPDGEIRKSAVSP